MVWGKYTTKEKNVPATYTEFLRYRYQHLHQHQQEQQHAWGEGARGEGMATTTQQRAVPDGSSTTHARDCLAGGGGIMGQAPVTHVGNTPSCPFALADRIEETEAQPQLPISSAHPMQHLKVEAGMRVK